MNLKRIYSRKMAEYLIYYGLQPVEVVPDIVKPRFLNWLFEDTPELEERMTEYTQSLHH